MSQSTFLCEVEESSYCTLNKYLYVTRLKASEMQMKDVCTLLQNIDR